jgi:hypothetical protein
MSVPVNLHDVPGSIARSNGVLATALGQWARRDDSKAQPEVRQAANTAMDTIDAMLAELHAAGAALAAEIRQSDDAAAARVDALLARLRHERPGGRP